MKKYSACEDIYPAVECRDDSENRADIFNIISIDGDVELYIASEVHEELRKKNHSIWMTRAKRASLEKVAASGWEDYRAEHPKSTIGMTRWYSSWWKAEPKCLKKAKEFEG